MHKKIRVLQRGYYDIYGSNQVCLLASETDYIVHRELERGDVIVNAVCVNTDKTVRAVIEKCNIINQLASTSH